MFQYEETTDDPFIDGDHLPIGIDSLDMREPRGIPSGSTVSILGDPRGMADLFVMHLIRTGRPTVYVSTVRTERSIRSELSVMGDGDAENLSIVEAFSVDEDIETIIETAGDQLDTGYNFVLDTATNLVGPEDHGRLVDLIRPLSQRVEENDALAYLYFATGSADQLSRGDREVLHLSDGVFHVTTGSKNDRIFTKLKLLKLRGCELPSESIRFKVGECLRIDTSRDIG